MKNIILKFLSLTLSLVLIANVYAQDSEAPEQNATSLENLLELIKAGKVGETREQRQREQLFESRRNQQTQIVTQLRQVKTQQEDLSRRLELQFEENTSTIAEKEKIFDESLGTLKEMFGHIQSAASDSAASFGSSVTAGQFGNERINFMLELSASMNDTSKLPSIEQLNQVWYELHRELTESGKIVKFNANIVSNQGESYSCEVVRVGLYNAVCDDKYLTSSITQNYSQLARQPAPRFTRAAERLSKADPSELTRFSIDPTGPTGGTLLNALIATPDLRERVEQGGIVGYVILSLGAVGVILSIIKFVTLTLTSIRVNAQKKSTSYGNNPLGRVFKVFADNSHLSLEDLELKLAEAILRERPKIERFVGFVKIISVVSPLLGLLGTVTGMIITFQQITLFGTGDPKTMAGGISTALITTVLGLTVAIPTVLLHSILNSRAKSILQILEEESIGSLAERDEEGLSNDAALQKASDQAEQA